MNRQQQVSGYVEVRLGALADNYARLRALAAGADVGAVVKADAYGLGAARIAEHLRAHGCSRFFVATLEEGIALRKAMAGGGGRATIYVFEGYRPETGHSYQEHDLRPVLNTAEQIRDWRLVGSPCAVHIDTGMSRLGVDVREAQALLSDNSAVRQLGVCHLMTHLACADEPENPQNRAQLELFNAVCQRIEAIETSVANSAGAFLGAPYHGDVVRAGIALYGGNPFAERENPTEPVATLFARVLQIRTLERAATVGYGATCVATAGSRIAAVGVGYADGYPRVLGNNAEAAVAGVRVPVVGRVSMDLTCLDITELAPESLGIGDYVEMFGPSVPVDEIAALSATISYEVLTGLNPRLPRVYVR